MADVIKLNENGHMGDVVFKIPVRAAPKDSMLIKSKAAQLQPYSKKADSKDGAAKNGENDSRLFKTEPFFNPVSPWMQDHLLKQPPTRFAAIEEMSDKQSGMFTSLLELESDVFINASRLSSCHHLRALSASTINASSEITSYAMIKQAYMDHLNEYKKLDPLNTLLAGFTARDKSHASQVQQRLISYRINRIRDQFTRLFRYRAESVCPSPEMQSEQDLHNALEETGHKIYKQMKGYMDFLSVKNTPTKSSTDKDKKEKANTTDKVSARKNSSGHVHFDDHVTSTNDDDAKGDKQMTPVTDRKEEGEITDEAERDDSGQSADDNKGTYSPSAGELEEADMRVKICPKVGGDDDDGETVAKKKKKKRKKSRSESEKRERKKRKKEKKREERSPEELPQAYSSNRNMSSQPDGSFRQYGFRPINYRGSNFNPFHNQGFRNMRGYHNNFRFQNRGNFRPFRRPYGNRPYDRSSSGPFMHRRRTQSFVSESSSDGGRRRSRSKSSRHERSVKSRSKSRSKSHSPSPPPKAAAAKSHSPDAPVQSSDNPAAEPVSAPMEHTVDDSAKQGDGPSTSSTNLLSEFV